jgi:hypothetical protein
MDRYSSLGGLGAIVEEIIPSPWDPPVREHAEGRALVAGAHWLAGRNRYINPKRTRPRSNPAALRPRSGMAELDRRAWAC